MGEETSEAPRRSMRQRVREASPIQAAIVGAVVSYIASNGVSDLLNRFAPDIKAEVKQIAVDTAKQNEKLDRLQQSVDRLWQIRGPKRDPAEGTEGKEK